MQIISLFPYIVSLHTGIELTLVEFGTGGYNFHKENCDQKHFLLNSNTTCRSICCLGDPASGYAVIISVSSAFFCQCLTQSSTRYIGLTFCSLSSIA